jgi:sigma-B regulation protein RsbU (phosphoserine phosphatase)
VFDALAVALFDDLTQTERFITAAAVTLAERQQQIELVNAGHNPTMIYRAASGQVEEIFGADTVLGFLPEPTHEVVETRLSPGDVLLLYTDGVTEAVDANGEMFEEVRLREVLQQAAAGSAEDILTAVFDAVSHFADKTDKGDDVSAVVVKAVATGNG